MIKTGKSFSLRVPLLRAVLGCGALAATTVDGLAQAAPTPVVVVNDSGTGSTTTSTPPIPVPSIPVDSGTGIPRTDAAEALPKYYFTTLAGGWSVGSADGSGAEARFNFPRGVAVDSKGNIYVADSGNHTVRKITPDGMVSTFAGKPGEVPAKDVDGALDQARFRNVQTVTVDAMGVVYVAEATDIRRIGLDGQVATLAGLESDLSDSTSFPASVDGAGTAARFGRIGGLTIDSSGTLYASDIGSATIRQITATGEVTTLAGSGSNGYNDGTGVAASFYWPSGLAVDAGGTLFVADALNQIIRKITSGGVVTTLAGMAGRFGSFDGVGTEARFYNPNGVAVNLQGTVYVADSINQSIRAISSSGQVTTLAGNPAGGSSLTKGAVDGVGLEARFNVPIDVATDAAGNVYVADLYNHCIRKVTAAGVVTTVAGAAPDPATNRSAGYADGIGSRARFDQPEGLAVGANGICYVADTKNQVIRKVAPDGTVTTLAGKPGEAGYADGQGSAARFRTPTAVVMDPAGNVIVSDSENYVIRKIAPDGTVSTVAGQPGVFGALDGSASKATFGYPSSLVVDSSGNLYAVDLGRRIRRIGVDGQVTTYIPNKDGFYAVSVFGLAIDGSDNLYASDPYNKRIIKITPNWVESEYADGNDTGFVPGRIAMDQNGRLFAIDYGGYYLGVVQPDGKIATIDRTDYHYRGHIDGLLESARFNGLTNIAFDGDGNLFLTSGKQDDNTIRIGIPAAGPTILTQPVSASVSVGGSTSFKVTAAGVPEPTYQWYFNRTALNGATSATLNLSAVNSGNGGSYYVSVRNEMGTAVSESATLTVTTGSSSSGSSGSSGSGGAGGGGGGAPSWWFVAGVAVLALGRAVRSRRFRAA